MKQLRLATVLILITLSLSITPAAHAAPVPVMVTILRVIEVSCDEGAFVPCPDDYFARVNIAGQGFQESGHIDNPEPPDIQPYWQFPATVDSAAGSVPVVIEIWDHEISSANDQLDVSSGDADRAIDLTLDLATGTWSGDVPANVGFSQGAHAKVLFDISLSGNGDLDLDGIPDGVERFGVRDGVGNLVADMAALGADPCRSTVAIEIDYMSGAADGHTHRPRAAAIAEAQAAFAGSTVPVVFPCPYAGFPTGGTTTPGANLVIDIDDALPEQQFLTWGASAEAVRDANFDPGRRPYFHYSLWVHRQSAGDNGSSGLCCSDSGKDLLVSLGAWAGQVGTVRDQSGTFLHELGHALGLNHGGPSTDGTNCKPNYLSVMSYALQTIGIPDPTIPGATVDLDGDGVDDVSARLDYSRSALPTLVESALDESAGIGDGTDFTTWSPDNGVNQLWAQGNAPINWDNDADGTIDPPPPPGVSVDLNNLGFFDCGVDAAGNPAPTPGETLGGYDDWSGLQYRGPLAAGASGSGVAHGPDLRFADAEILKAATATFVTPDLALTKAVDLPNANPGDTLSYTVTTENVGTGAAQSVHIVDTLPNGAVETRSLGVLGPGQSRVETLTYSVPCATGDLATLVNSATVAGTNLLNNPEVNTSNNAASASTTVHAPVMTLSKTATSSVIAGDAISYRMTYENTGSGESENVVITDTLPDDVYYSESLDQGAGPKPSSVTPNADGTTTLTWNVGDVGGGSGPMTIEYTARPSLLFLAGSSVANGARLTFTNANDCTYAPVPSSHATGITAVSPTRNPLTIGFWKTHPEQWTSEILARIQATDQRFDGPDGSSPDGQLSAAEAAAVFGAGGPQPNTLRAQLLGTYFNLATRRINAGTAIDSKTVRRLGLHDVRDGALFAMATLAVPLSGNADRYSEAITVLDEINANRSEVYG